MKRVCIVMICAVLAVGFWSAPAQAQSDDGICDVDLADFTDPNTGVVDFDAYFDALFCGTDVERPPDVIPAGQGVLARTGSDTQDLLVAGLVLLVLGAVAVGAGRRTRSSTESPV